MATRIRRTVGAVVAAVLMITGLPASARAVTLHDLMALSRAGLSDSVLIALVQSDPTIYQLDARQILELKRAGVSDPVIVALLRNGRTPAVPAEPPQPAALPAAPPEQAPAPSSQTTATSPGAALPGLVIIGGHSSPSPPATADIVVMPVPGFYPVRSGNGRRGRGSSCPGESAFRAAGGGPALPPTGQVGALPNGFIGAGYRTGAARGIHIRGAFVDGWHLQNPLIVSAHVRGQ